MVVVGLDVGTNAVKASAFDSNGTRLAFSRRGYRLISPSPGCYELDPAEVYSAIEFVIGEASKQVGKGKIEAVAASVLGEAVVPVDRKKRPLSNTILAIDTRALREAEEFARQYDRYGFFQKTGQILHPMASIFKILWWKKNQPDIYARADAFYCWSEMTALLFGVPPAIPPSLAGRTGLMAIQTTQWDNDLLSSAGLEARNMAPITSSATVLGKVGEEQIARFGLAPDCFFVQGGWDQVCNSLGSGATEQGTVVNSMGSTDSLNCIYRGIRTSQAMLENNFSCNPYFLPGYFCTNAFTSSGGNLLTWFKEKIDTMPAPTGEEKGGKRSDKDNHGHYYETIISEALRSRNPIMVLPHFTGTGTPYMDPTALGAMFGFSLATEKRDIVLGLIESVCFELSLNLDRLQQTGISVEKIVANGKSADNGELLSLRSDIFSRPIQTLAVEEAGCLGAALLCVAALDDNLSLTAITERWTEKGALFQPDENRSASYRKKTAVYKQLYGTTRDVQREIHEVGLFQNG